MSMSPRRTPHLKLLLVFALFICAIAQRSPEVAAGPGAALPAARTTMQATPAPMSGQAALPQLSDDNMIVPLPRGCGRVLAAGEIDPRPCCLIGVVYVDGLPVAGAEIEIQTPSGRSHTILSLDHETTGSSLPPYYEVGLSAGPLMLSVGETITLTARYSSHERTLTHQVRSDGQRLDFVLSRNQALDLLAEHQIRGRAPEGHFNAPGGLAVDRYGFVFVVDEESAQVQVFDERGLFVNRWGTFGNLPGQLNRPSGIVIDRSNNVYIADTGNHRIQKFSRVGGVMETFGSYGSLRGQLNAPTGLALGPENQLYVTDTGNRRVQIWWPDNRVWETPWTSAGNATLSRPTGVAVDGAGLVYVSDHASHQIHTYDALGGWLGSRGGYGNLAGELNAPWSLAAGADGTVYVSDTNNHRVQVLPPQGEPLIWREDDWQSPRGIALGAAGELYVVDSGNFRVRMRDEEGQWSGWGERGRADGQLDTPMAVATAADGSIYVADTRNDRIQRFTAQGSWLQTWDMPRGINEDPGLPTGIAVSDAGLVYVADTGAHRVLRFSADGELQHSWGGIGTGPGKFLSPYGLAVDQAGAVYVADAGNQRVQKFDASGTWLDSWGAEGTANGQFRSPRDVAVAPDGSIYVLDKGNQRVQQFTPDGSWLASWGSAGDGPGELSQADGLAVDADGNVYVADTGNQRIQIWAGDGAWLASWSQSGSGFGQLSNPRGVAVTPAGTVVIADTLNQRLQLARPMTHTQPHATIVHLSNEIIAYNEQLVAFGMGQDSDESDDIVAYRWSSSRQDLPDNDSPTLAVDATALVSGTHVLMLEVQDGEDDWSPSASVKIIVEPPPVNDWTMLLYLAGDYHDRGRLLAQMRRPLEALSASLPTASLRVVAQLDGPGSSDTVRWLIRPGDPGQPPRVTTIPLAKDVDMSEPQSLAEFVRWGQYAFPAPRYYLAIAGLGQAAHGMSGDASSDAQLADPLTADELGQALSSDNIDPIDLLHLDMGSMATLEVAYALRDHAEILIASQYLTWGYFAYDDYAAEMTDNARPVDVAHAIVERYAQLAEAEDHPYTLSALDLRRSDALLTALDELAAELAALIENGQLERSVFEQLWAESQKLESNGDHLIGPDDVYIDLLDWARRLNQLLAAPELQERIVIPVLQARLATFVNELEQTPYILHSRSSSGWLDSRYGQGGMVELAGAGGLSIIYPGTHNTYLFSRYVTNQLFALTSDSRWPDFLIAGRPLVIITDGALPALLPPLEANLPDRPKIFLPVMVK